MEERREGENCMEVSVEEGRNGWREGGSAWRGCLVMEGEREGE